MIFNPGPPETWGYVFGVIDATVFWFVAGSVVFLAFWIKAKLRG